MFINLLKITLAILFFLCLANMPYGYYEFIRFIAMVGFVCLGYKSYEEGNKSLAFIYAALPSCIPTKPGASFRRCCASKSFSFLQPAFAVL